MNGPSHSLLPVFLGLSAAVGLAATAAAPPPDSFTNRLDNSLREHLALSRFQQYAPAAKLGSTTPAKILRAVQEGTGLRIKVDWEALGLDPNASVTIPVKPLSYDRLLHALSALTGVPMVLSFDERGGVFILTAGGVSDSDDSEKQTSSKIKMMPLEGQALRQKLDMTIDKMQLDQQSFVFALRTWQQKTGLNLDINWTALQAAGIDKNTPVSIDVADVPARKILTILLAKAGGGAANLGYTIDDNIITISTMDDLNSPKYQVVYVYNIHRYLASPHPEHLRLDERVKELVDTIKTSIAPDSWFDAGGTIGSVRWLDDFLIINQTGNNQIAVTNLLLQLHAIGRGPSKSNLKEPPAAPQAKAKGRFE